ncbi:hypothetical protein C8F04DRAFT_1401938 [Mycena alexandri]|uniref:Uncharacterized protein n=1 Tax=Mycena alexandri TaxID=1745969 RepID=A0AAD6WS59_9AGAR|nr:hypothetical protein C8F04DRAFT_1401938 [Mycena alexandri]
MKDFKHDRGDMQVDRKLLRTFNLTVVMGSHGPPIPTMPEHRTYLPRASRSKRARDNCYQQVHPTLHAKHGQQLLPLFSLPALYNRLYYGARGDSPYGREQAQRKPDDRKAHAAGTIRAYTRTPIHRARGAVLLHLPTLSLIVALLYTLLTLLTTAAPAPPPALPRYRCQIPSAQPQAHSVRVCACPARRVSANRDGARRVPHMPGWSLPPRARTRSRVERVVAAANVTTRARPLRRSNPRRLNATTNTLAASSLDDSGVSKSARCVDSAPPPPPAIPGATNSGLAPQVRAFLFHLISIPIPIPLLLPLHSRSSPALYVPSTRSECARTLHSLLCSSAARVYAHPPLARGPSM